MNWKRSVFLLLGVTLIFALSACSGGAPNVDWEVSITGDVDSPRSYSYQELASMDQVELNEVMMEKSTGEDEVTSWSGADLTALLEEAGAGDFSTLTALAADGYAIEVSADELEGAIIALKDSGEWIAEINPDKGPIRLVTPETPANRWVFQLVEIQVNQ